MQAKRNLKGQGVETQLENVNWMVPCQTIEHVLK